MCDNAVVWRKEIELNPGFESQHQESTKEKSCYSGFLFSFTIFTASIMKNKLYWRYIDMTNAIVMWYANYCNGVADWVMAHPIITTIHMIMCAAATVSGIAALVWVARDEIRKAKEN